MHVQVEGERWSTCSSRYDPVCWAEASQVHLRCMCWTCQQTSLLDTVVDTRTHQPCSNLIAPNGSIGYIYFQGQLDCKNTRSSPQRNLWIVKDSGGDAKQPTGSHMSCIYAAPNIVATNQCRYKLFLSWDWMLHARCSLHIGSGVGCWYHETTMLAHFQTI